jgi:predicted nuclease with TOPRIM domain
MGERTTDVHQRINDRLRELRQEYEAGQRKLTQLDAERAAIRDTMLRISGAIQALAEMVAEKPDSAQAGDVRPGNGPRSGGEAGVEPAAGNTRP